MGIETSSISILQLFFVCVWCVNLHSHNTGRKLFDDCSIGNILPPPDVFKKSIYTFYIGQNDFISKLASNGSIDGVRDYIPQIVSQIDAAIKV